MKVFSHKKLSNQSLIAALMFAVILCSCTSKKVLYLEDMHYDTSYQVTNPTRIEAQPNDLLAIAVSCKTPELAVPFNSPNASVQVSDDATITLNTGGAKTDGSGYRVDNQGNIMFPVLGSLHVGGMTLTSIANMIRERIIQGNYIKDPQVSVDLLNFKYTVIGAVAHNGTFHVDGSRLNLLQAIANAGDLTVKANPERVTVIRSEGDAVIRHTHDIRDVDLFMSPYYYLQPNDIVYVEPKYGKSDGEDRVWQYVTVFTSLASVGVSLVWALSRR